MGVRTTDHQPVTERFDFWRHVLSMSFAPLEALPAEEPPPPSFHAEVRSELMGGLRVATVTASPHRVRRTPRLIAQDDDHYFALSLQLRGACAVVRDGHSELIGPDELMVLDCARPYDLIFDDDHQMLCFGFPRSMLSLPPDKVEPLTATPLSAQDGVGALLAPFLTGLARQVHGGTVSSPTQVGGAVLSLMETMLIELSGEDVGLDADAPRPSPLPRIKIDIESRLSTPDLPLAEIAATHQLSLRGLREAFEAEGGSLAEWVMARRLEHCRRDLRDPTLAGVPAALIGARWGLPDEQTFVRLFTAAFQASPAEYRLLPSGDAASRRGVLG